MSEVIDPYGVRWSVRRRHWYDMSNWNDADAVDDGWSLVTFTLLAVAWWPVWFSTHWLGLPWRIVIKRDGKTVDEEEVRGWHESRRRIREITEWAAAETLQQSPAMPPVEPGSQSDETDCGRSDYHHREGHKRPLQDDRHAVYEHSHRNLPGRSLVTLRANVSLLRRRERILDSGIAHRVNS